MRETGHSFSDFMHTSAELASDPILKAQTEDEIRMTLSPGFSFHIDSLGIGHFYSVDPFVSSVVMSVVDASGCSK